MVNKTKLRLKTFFGAELTSRKTLAVLIRQGQLHDMREVARITGLNVVYLRRLCHGMHVGHHRLLGRFYMTPPEVAALLRPVVCGR